MPSVKETRSHSLVWCKNKNQTSTKFKDSVYDYLWFAEKTDTTKLQELAKVGWAIWIDSADGIRVCLLIFRMEVLLCLTKRCLPGKLM
jgi:hypothetical protein